MIDSTSMSNEQLSQVNKKKKIGLQFYTVISQSNFHSCFKLWEKRRGNASHLV